MVYMQPESPSDHLVFPPIAQQPQVYMVMPGFYVGVEDLNSGSHACIASAITN